MTTKNKVLHSSIEQRVGFVKNEMALFEAKVLKMVQERDASTANAEKFWLVILFIPGPAEEAKKLRER